MEQEEEGQLTGPDWGSDSGPMVSATVGRIMTTLLNAKPKKLQDAISRLHSPPKVAPVTGIYIQYKYLNFVSVLAIC